jgi:hypothetical protein
MKHGLNTDSIARERFLLAANNPCFIRVIPWLDDWQPAAASDDEFLWVLIRVAAGAASEEELGEWVRAGLG